MSDSKDPESHEWPFDPKEWRRKHTNEELFANSKPLRVYPNTGARQAGRHGQGRSEQSEISRP